MVSDALKPNSVTFSDEAVNLEQKVAHPPQNPASPPALLCSLWPQPSVREPLGFQAPSQVEHP